MVDVSPYTGLTDDQIRRATAMLDCGASREDFNKSFTDPAMAWHAAMTAIYIRDCFPYVDDVEAEREKEREMLYALAADAATIKKAF